MTYGNPNTDLVAQVGAANLPPDPSLVPKLVTALDPARDILLGLIEYAIKAQLEPVWDKIKPHLSSKFQDGYVINQVMGYSPEQPILLGEKVSFPLLALWRDKSTFKDYSLQTPQKQTTWNLLYVVGQTSLDDVGKLHGLMNAVENVVDRVIDNGFCPNYLDGYQCLIDPNFGAKFYQVLLSTSGPSSMTIPKGDSLITYEAQMMTIETMENVTFPSDVYPDATGVIIHANIPDGYLGTLLDVAVGDSAHLPDNN